MRKHTLFICLALFFLAFAVRTLTWQDNKRDAWKVQTYVTSGYKDSAHQLARGDFKTFVSDVNHLGHPPGYPILLAALFKTVGDSNTAIQFIQTVCDSAAVVVLFLIAGELFQIGVAVLAGALAVLSPQFAYFSVLLLPDSLIVLPILLAVYFIVRTRSKRGLVAFLIAGALIGLSCWLRANALFLAPFLALLTPFFLPKGKRLPAGSAIVAGAILIIAPITIKNAIVFRRFIPLSLGAGQTLLEGISDYDEKGTLNIPNTDLGIMRQEAQWYGKPDYALLLFGEDGIDRDRMRVARGFAVIRSHPVWFAGVMGQRAIASTRLDPVPVLQPESPVSHKLDDSLVRSIWGQQPGEITSAASERSPKATFTVVDNQWLRIDADLANYGSQLTTSSINVNSFHDYVLKLPFKLESGRAAVKVLGAANNKVIATMMIDLVEGVQDQPVNELAIPFVSANNSQVRVVIANNASSGPTMLVGPMQLDELGPGSLTWLRFVRLPVGAAQRFFTTAWVLPFVVIGIVVLIRRRKLQELAILLAVPAYYLIVQSALHTERRYVYIIHFFFLVLASVSICWLAESLKGIRRRRVE